MAPRLGSGHNPCMSYFADLTTHTYFLHEPEPGVLNIGWLGEGNPIPTGPVPQRFVDTLEKLCAHPVNLHRGYHFCEYCEEHRAKGNGQIRVCSAQGIWYAAPTMVHHYVSAHHYQPPEEFIDAVLQPAHVADRVTENDQETWESDLRASFPLWKTDAATELWPVLKPQLAIGQEVKGLVVARAHFGVWVHIGVGIPALLLVPNMWRAAHERVAFTDYPPKGTTVRARINALGDDCEIGLTQHDD